MLPASPVKDQEQVAAQLRRHVEEITFLDTEINCRAIDPDSNGTHIVPAGKSIFDRYPKVMYLLYPHRLHVYSASYLRAIGSRIKRCGSL